MYQVCRMIVFILFGNTAKHLKFFFVRFSRHCDDVEDIIIRRFLKHAIGTHIEIVAGPDVGEVGDIRFYSMLLTRLHDPGDDILLWMVLGFLFCYLSNSNKVIYKRVVLRAKDDEGGTAIRCGSQLIHATVAYMGNRCSVSMQADEGHCCTHLSVLAVVLGIKCIESGGECLF